MIRPGTLLLVCWWSASSYGQGTINFDNNVPGVLRAPVYGLEVEPGCDDLAKTGNTVLGIPAGTQTYSGALLSGSGFSAALFGGLLGADPASMILLGTTTFRSGAGAGFFVPGTLSFPGLAAGDRASFQVRVWDNQNGSITSWAQVIASGGAAPFGESDVFSPETGLGGNGASALNLVGLTSFNIHALGDGTVCVPEPSAWALTILVVGVVGFGRITRREAS